MTRRKTHEILSEHPLVKAALEGSNLFVESVGCQLVENTRRTGRLPRRKTEPEKNDAPGNGYASRVLQKIASVTGIMERLEVCRVFVARARPEMICPEDGVGYHTWLDYHFAHFVVLMIGAYDVALLLVNEVLRLGNQERNCKSWIITTNCFVRDTEVANRLESLGKVVEPYRQLRNCYVHRGSDSGIVEALDSGDSDAFMLMSSVSMMTSESVVSPALLGLLFHAEADKNIGPHDPQDRRSLQTLYRSLRCVVSALHGICLIRSFI